MNKTGLTRSARDRPDSTASKLIAQVERLKAHADELERKLELLQGGFAGDAERSILDQFAATTRGWFWETDSQLRFTYLSPSIYDVIGIEPEWHYGKSRYEFSAPNSVSKAGWDAHLGQLERFESFKDFVYLRQAPKGDCWLSTSGQPYFDKAGGFLGYRGSAIDVTDDMEIRKNAEILFAAIQNLAEPCVLWDADDTLLLSNRRFREVSESFADLAKPGTHVEDHVRAGVAAGFFPDADLDPEAWIQFRLSQFHEPQEAFELNRRDGSCVLLRDYKLQDGGTITTATDITTRKRAEMLLKHNSEILQTALLTIPDGIQVLDDEINLIAWNDTLYDVMELDRAAVMALPNPGHAFFEIIAKRGDYGPGDIDALVESRLKPLRDKQSVCFERQLISGKWIECRGGPVPGGGYVAVYRDIDASKRMTERLQDLASIDELTRLYNRRHFLELASGELERSKRYGRELSFLMLDLDHFKIINDTHGHAAGDAVLRVVADTLSKSVRDSDRIGRLGGEEFTIMLPDTGREEARLLAERIRMAISQLVIDFQDAKIRITSSFGIAAVDTRHKTLENVLDAADKALYEAKRAGRNRVVDSGELA